jgi:hypothetical protein
MVEAQHPSNLTVRYDNRELRRGVMSIDIGLWNAGGRAIPKSDIDCLRPSRHTGEDPVTNSLTLKLSGRARILDVGIREQVNLVSAVAVSKSECDSSAADLSWNSLKPKDGAKVRILYEGEGAETLALVGRFTYGDDPRRAKITGRVESERDRASAEKKKRRVLAKVVVLVGACLLNYWCFRIRQCVRRGKTETLDVIMALVALAMIGVGIYLFWWLRVSAPPFEIWS